MNDWIRLAPYLFLLLVMGLGWFIIAPLVPELGTTLGVSLSSVLLLISIYGYALIVLSLPAGWLSAKFTIKRVLYASSAFSAVGLVGRALSPGYSSFLITGLVAAIAFPLAIAPVGSVAESLFKGRSHAVIGMSLGMLFLGMGLGSLLGPWIYSLFGIHGALWLTAVLSVVAAVWIFVGVRDYPKYSGTLREVFKPGMIKNWYVGFAIPPISVLFGSVISTVLRLHGLPESSALYYSGLIGGLIFIGAAIGSMVLPLFFERRRMVRAGLVITGTIMFVFVTMMTLSLSFTTMIVLIAISYFFSGFFANAYVSMAMASTTHYVSNPSEAGFVTSIFNTFTGIGIALIPMFLGVEFGSLSTIYIGAFLLLAIEFVAMLLSPMLRAGRSSGNAA